LISLQFGQTAQLAGGTLVTPERSETKFSGVSIDSRTVRTGELFIALRGQRSDGHAYLEQAIVAGASGVLVENEFVSSRAAVIRVPDSHEAMMRLASRYRDLTTAEYVGITGSNGKTTTKEMTYTLLSSVTTDVYRSAGNLNNLYGLPLALFVMPQSTRVAIMEMGISTPGEMTRLSSIIRPDVAVITSVAATHLEFLGTVEGVATAKLELVTNSSPNTPVVINADDPVLVTAVKRHKPSYISFGIESPANFKPSKMASDNAGNTTVEIEGHEFVLPLFGRHQIYNLLAAYAVARTLGYSFDGIDTRAIPFTTAPMRGQRVERAGVTFIVDCYNANPESVKLGLRSFDELRFTERRVLILGDMLELGEHAIQYHQELGWSLKGHPADLIMLVGPLSKSTYDAAKLAGVPASKLHHYADAAACAAEVRQLVKSGDLVYLKGSRGIGLERVFDAFATSGGKV
jgi:UDP-N-acetylmuramoyl-tripeptide--D-alanyl-D-alanine ligase